MEYYVTPRPCNNFLLIPDQMFGFPNSRGLTRRLMAEKFFFWMGEEFFLVSSLAFPNFHFLCVSTNRIPYPHLLLPISPRFLCGSLFWFW